MKLFQNLFKPKWKHKDPEIRKNALLALDATTHQEIFLETATSDDSSEIRILSVKRLTDIDQLHKISVDNSDEKVRSLASKMLSQIYSGEIQSSFDVSKLPEFVSKITDQKLLEHIAQSGVSTQIRRSAISHITRDALLGNLAINESDAALRLLAAEKIQQKSTLERVYKSVKTRDKTISSLVKNKLDEMLKAEQEPLQRIEQQKQMCLQMELLGTKGLWERDKLAFDSLLQRWSEISEHTAPYESRFESARQGFEQAYSAYLKRHEDRLKQEQALIPVKQSKREIISQIQTLINKLESLSVTDDTAAIESEYKETGASWDAIALLPADMEQEFASQYKDVSNTFRNKLRQLKQNRDQAITLEFLQDELQKILAKPAKLSELTLAHLEKRVNAISNIADNEYTAKLKTNITSLVHNAHTFLKNRQTEIEQHLKTLKSELELMESKYSQGILKEALTARKNVQSIIDKLENLGHRKLNEYKQRANAISGELNQLADWRSWANTPQKEELCSRVEALIGSSEDPKEIAFLINKAKNDWKAMGPSERDSSQQLWERFQTACDAAYEPCKAFFKEEAKQKKESYAKRISFLENLEKFIETADWNSVDWKKVESLHRHSRDEWQSLGQTDAEHRKELNKRFYAAVEKLKSELNKEWGRNREKKEKILAKAIELSAIEDIDAAINSAKDLQNQWKTSGRVPQSIERTLWEQFRKACDAVFHRREEVKLLEKQKQDELASEKFRACDAIEKMASLPVNELYQQRGQFEKLVQDFKDKGETVKSGDIKLERKVAEALHLFELKMESAGKMEFVSLLQELQTCVKAVEAAELAIESNLSPIQIGESVENASSIIGNAEKLKVSPWKNPLEKRLANAIKVASTQNFQELLRENIQAVKSDKRYATIQLEILANAETPAEFANDKLSVQAQRLSDKLKNHAVENHWQAFIDTESKWWLIGPTSCDELEALKKRRDNAIANLKNDYPEELRNYN